MALGDLGDMSEAILNDYESHSSCQCQGEASNCTVFFGRLGLFVNSMHAPLSWQQRILSSLNGILKKQLLKISSCLTRYYQGMKTYFCKRDILTLLICRIIRVRLRKGNTNIQQLLTSNSSL